MVDPFTDMNHQNTLALNLTVALFLTIVLATQIGCQTLSTSSTVHQESYQYKNADGETVTRTIEVKRNPVYTDSWRDPAPTPTPVVLTPVRPINKNTGVLSVAPTDPSTNGTVTKPESQEKTSSGFTGSLEVAMTSGHVHLGAHAGIGFVNWWDLRLGVSAFFSKDVYTGFDLSTRAYVPFEWKIRPYVGLGLYFGDSRSCYTESLGGGLSVEICDKKFLSAGYGEAGLDLGGFHLFVRDYNITRAGLSVPAETFYGIGVTTRF